jgi:hypothetical protein
MSLISPVVLTNAGVDTVSNGFLEQFGFIINTTHSIVICLECRCAIDPKQPRKHMVKYHADMKLPKDMDKIFQEQMGRDYPHLTAHPEHPVAPVMPIFGLEPPRSQYQLCQNCHRAFQGNGDCKPTTGPSNAFRVHKCFAGLPAPKNRPFTITSVQRFNSRPPFTWFPVQQLASPSTPSSSPWISYRTQMESRPHQTESLSLPDNYRILHQFIQKERWLDHVSGKDHGQLMALVDISVKDAQLPLLQKHVHAYLAHFQSRIKGHYIRRLIGTRPSTE